MAAVELGDLPKPAASELALAKTLVDQLRKTTFDTSAYTDDVKPRVRALLAEKAKTGEDIVAPETGEARARPVDLMAALRASLGAAGCKTHGEEARDEAGDEAGERACRTPARGSVARTTPREPLTCEPQRVSGP